MTSSRLSDRALPPRFAEREAWPMGLGSGRDFVGYGRAIPQARWPGDARVAVSFVVNFEEGAEFAVSDGDPKNEAISEVERRLDGASDLCLDSHFECGARAGWWRIMEAFDAHGAKATVSTCGRAVERTPELARDAVARGHEVSAHRWRWESHAGMSEAEERERISRTVAAIAGATGHRPVGWHTRSAASPNTRRLLMEERGFLYDSDAYNDDLPYLVGEPGRPHVVLPYAFDTKRHAVPQHESLRPRRRLRRLRSGRLRQALSRGRMRPK
jgi:allantoinase